MYNAEIAFAKNLEKTPEPNCEKVETRADAPGLFHDWKYISENRYGLFYVCRRCGVQDVD